MQDLGAATYILGIQIKCNQEARTISLSQQQYVKTIVERCGMSNSKPTWTLLSTSSKLTVNDPKNNTTVNKMEIGGKKVTYSSVVGSLMYAMIGTRPDITYAVGVLGCFSANPKRQHWTVAK